MSGVDSAGAYNFRIGDSVLEFNVEEPLSDAKIKASIEESLLSSSIDDEVSVVVAWQSGSAADVNGSANCIDGIEVLKMI